MKKFWIVKRTRDSIDLSPGVARQTEIVESGAKPQAPASVPVSSATNPAQISSSPSRPVAKPTPAAGDRFKLTPNNAAAGVKRKSEESENAQKSKIVKTESTGTPSRQVIAPSSRFQLSTKTKHPPVVAHRLATPSANSAKLPKTVPNKSPKHAPAAPTHPAGNGTAPKPKGFLSMLEQAKAAQEAAKAANAGGIKHKPVEKLTKRERLRLMEEQKARAKSGKKAVDSTTVECAGTQPLKSGPTSKRPAEPLSYQGTMKKPTAAPLAYKGTMGREPSGAPKASAKQKGMGQDKYGGYASWSDLSDAEDEDEEEDDYDSDEDMEAGFEDVGMEEEMALRAARKEDQEAQREEERLKAEKAARKRKLLELSRKAAAGKRF
nr:hypothetical protein CFP56_09905 [Quercus suber]